MEGAAVIVITALYARDLEMWVRGERYVYTILGVQSSTRHTKLAKSEPQLFLLLECGKGSVHREGFVVLDGPFAQHHPQKGEFAFVPTVRFRQ